MWMWLPPFPYETVVKVLSFGRNVFCVCARRGETFKGLRRC